MAYNTSPDEKATPPGIDARGPRVGAGITALLLAVVILLGQSTAALVLLAVVAASFAVGAVLGTERTWQSWVYRVAVRPRLGPATEREDPRPPRFAQSVGLVITGAGVALGVAGVAVAVPITAAIALVAAVLNAAFGLCLGCEMYLLLKRLAPEHRQGR
ncbi:DUF4395 domain-containing protein [Oerskovia flava]|uniref:DUF4395 domain-containing protein n=1 Tax=Oerskovia flava TaxID=2986422 RepID=UPI002240D794|nr:DUF4395 domain-containing protein [Oerskovia sp. JB1-3-2]